MSGSIENMMGDRSQFAPMIAIFLLDPIKCRMLGLTQPAIISAKHAARIDRPHSVQSFGIFRSFATLEALDAGFKRLLTHKI